VYKTETILWGLKQLPGGRWLSQGWGTYLLSRAAGNVHYRRRAGKSIGFILKFNLYLTMRNSSDFS